MRSARSRRGSNGLIRREDGIIVVVNGSEGFQWLDTMLRSTSGRGPDWAVTVDTETFGSDIKKESAVGMAKASSVQFSTKEFPKGIYLDTLDENVKYLPFLRNWAEDPNALKVGHNFKYETIVFRNHGMKLKGLYADTIILDYMLNSSREGRHDLETACYDWKLSPVELDSYSDTFKWFPLTRNGKGPPSKVAKLKSHVEWWREGETDRVIKYACKDTEWTQKLLRHHERAIRDVPWVGKKSMWDYYTNIERRFSDVLAEMEIRGTYVDVDRLDELHETFAADIEKAGADFYEALAKQGLDPEFIANFNDGSPTQLSELLFDTMDIDPIKGDSVDKVVLDELVKQGHDFLVPLQTKRSLEKLDGTYAVALAEWGRRYGGKIHTGLNQIGTATMRLSSSKPNLQNIPTRTKLGKMIRSAFIAPPGQVIYDADYSQIELRVTAHKSQDEVLLTSFRNGLDPHAFTAISLFEHVEAAAKKQFPGRSLEDKEVQKWVKATFDDERSRGKTWNFMVLYGGGVKRAMDVFGVSERKAKQKIDQFFSLYPGVRAMLDRAQKRARENGYVTTITQRRAYIVGADSYMAGVRAAAERQAGNYEVQGSAGDIIKMAMILLHEDKVLTEEMEVLLRLQVHDELLFTGPAGEAEEREAKKRIDAIMSNPFQAFGFGPLRVPTPADCHSGKNWAEAKQ